MAGAWMAVVLLLLLSDGGSAVDQNKLAQLIKDINDKYGFRGMIAMALSIKDEDTSNLQQILVDNPKDTINNMINNNNVYRGRRFAVARVERRAPHSQRGPDTQREHAEYRLLTDLELDSDDGDLLVFHSFASPCSTCTQRGHDYGIIEKIERVIQGGNWTESVWVYETIFKPSNQDPIPESELSQNLQSLAGSGITLANIFRCFYPKNIQTFGCTSCSSAGGVTKACVNYEA